MTDEGTPVPDEATPEGADRRPAPEVLTTTPVAATPAAPRSAGRSAAVWWGVVLVVLGGALLVSQFVPGLQLWRFWPLIIVAAGIRGMFGSGGEAWSPRHLAGGLSTVAFGLVLLGQMVGYLDWSVWLNILRLWPLLLVSLGIEVLGKGLRNEWVRALSSLVVIAGLAYGALVMTPTAGWPIPFMPSGTSEPFAFEAAHDSGVTEGSVRIDGGVGRLTVEAGDRLASSEGRSPFKPVFETSVSAGEAEVRIGPGVGAWGPVDGDAQTDVTLDREVLWDLDVSAGVTEHTVDLSDLKVRSLKLEAGVSDGTLVLGRPGAAPGGGPTSVRIDAGVSDLLIRVPRGEAARVRVSSGLTGVEVRGAWDERREGDTRLYESDGFRDGGRYWDLDVQAGVGRIVIERY